MANPWFFPQDSSDEEDAIFWAATQEEDPLPANFLYVDDATLFDVVPQHLHPGTAATRETLSDIERGKVFIELSDRSEAMGM